MSDYTELSNAVNTAMTTRNHELADALRKQLHPLSSEVRYATLLGILDKIPDPVPVVISVHSRLKSAQEGTSIAAQETEFERSGKMTVAGARQIVTNHNRFKSAHQKIMQTNLGRLKKQRKLDKLRRDYLAVIHSINPTYMGAEEKLEEAQALLGLQTHGGMERDGSLVMSPRFQGGRMLRRGLPGSKR